MVRNRKRSNLQIRRWRQNRWLAGLAIFGLTMILAAIQFQGPAVISSDPRFEGQISGERVLSEMEYLIGPQLDSHAAGTEANRRVRERLIGRLLDLDVQVVERSFDSPFGKLINVIGHRVGIPTRHPILLVTHYDSTPFGPGAGDDISGVAAVLEILRCLQASGASPELWLLFSDGEERGLLGAKQFSEDPLPWGTETPIVLNMDSRGTSGSSVMYETHRNQYGLLSSAGQAMMPPRYANSLMVNVYERMPYATDYTIFKQMGWPGLNFAVFGGAYRYHTKHDEPSQMSLRSLQHIADHGYRLIRSMEQWTDRQWLAIVPSEPAVFFDLFGTMIICYPAFWNPWLTVLGWLACLIYAFRLHASGRLRPRVWLKLFVGVLAMLFGGYLLGWCWTWVLRKGEVVDRPFVEWGTALAMVHSLYALALMASFGAWVFGTSHVHHARLGIMSIYAFLATVTTVLLPGGTFLFHGPLLWMFVLYMFVGPRRYADYLSAVLAAILFAPLSVLVLIAVGPTMGELIGMGTILVLIPTLPLLSDFPNSHDPYEFDNPPWNSDKSEPEPAYNRERASRQALENPIVQRESN